MLRRGAPVVNCCAAISSGSSRLTTEERTANSGPRLQTVLGKAARRCREAAGWALPAGILALLPKCPACIVAYLAIGSGIGISISTATYLRIGLITLCAASLTYFAVSRAHRYLARRPEAKPSQNHFAAKSCQ
ncbi:MAG: hypothetical protein WAL08_06000 [Candidatus Sulfotelmatobacter sp.]